VLASVEENLTVGMWHLTTGMSIHQKHHSQKYNMYSMVVVGEGSHGTRSALVTRPCSLTSHSLTHLSRTQPQIIE
jgi:hypothetical protein